MGSRLAFEVPSQCGGGGGFGRRDSETTPSRWSERLRTRVPYCVWWAVRIFTEALAASSQSLQQSKGARERADCHEMNVPNSDIESTTKRVEESRSCYRIVLVLNRAHSIIGHSAFAIHDEKLGEMTGNAEMAQYSTGPAGRKSPEKNRRLNFY